MGRCFSVLASLSQYFQSPDCVSHSKYLVAGLDEPPPVDVFLVLLIILYCLMLVKVLWMLVRYVKVYFIGESRNRNSHLILSDRLCSLFLCLELLVQDVPLFLDAGYHPDAL